MSRSLMAFYNDMRRFQKQMTIVVHSEFGRRLKSNQSDGTDHGHGGVHMVLGGGIKGGKLYGDWKGLANEQLDHGADLAVTTDYRAVLHEVLANRVGLADTKGIFPGFEVNNALGIVVKTIHLVTAIRSDQLAGSAQRPGPTAFGFWHRKAPSWRPEHRAASHRPVDLRTSSHRGFRISSHCGMRLRTRNGKVLAFVADLPAASPGKQCLQVHRDAR